MSGGSIDDTARVRDPRSGRGLDRWQRLAGEREKLLAGWRQTREQAKTMRPIHMAWASACIAGIADPDTIFVNEYTLMPEHCPSTRPGGYFASSPASGLGWGGGGALGAKLAEPDRFVVCVLGDGSHLFGNPVALHHAARLHKLPALFVVMNNSQWGAVRRAALGMYPQGEAARSNKPPLIDLDDLPAFEAVCEAAGGYGERVEDPADLPAALARAKHEVFFARPPGALDKDRTFGLCLGEQNGIAAPRYSLTEALEGEETTGVGFERERVYGCPRRTSAARTALRPGGRAAPGSKNEGPGLAGSQSRREGSINVHQT